MTAEGYSSVALLTACVNILKTSISSSRTEAGEGGGKHDLTIFQIGRSKEFFRGGLDGNGVVNFSGGQVFRDSNYVFYLKGSCMTHLLFMCRLKNVASFIIVHLCF